eukprot:CAMPEP_0172518322 /NCGR_PEP_ID=MMETSP1066-20121228/290740_1 /TAXON_ID=671091 /ORGANISM="Coscinodiscus wailesii, Strain CCMP2513" /LENGTH=49 /DNA_ID=CAMNT_0013300689 /DNA_START=1159 /DNA_END=1308 /DNA_ORIENTATION=-
MIILEESDEIQAISRRCSTQHKNEEESAIKSKQFTELIQQMGSHNELFD